MEHLMYEYVKSPLKSIDLFNATLKNQYEKDRSKIIIKTFDSTLDRFLYRHNFYIIFPLKRVRGAKVYWNETLSNIYRSFWSKAKFQICQE